MAEAATSRPFEHRRWDWGETFSGTKAQLQCVGIGVGLAFPGEPGGAKRAMTVSHSSGLRVQIERRDDQYVGWMPYRDKRRIEAFRRRSRTEVFAAGVRLYKAPWGWDVYTGAASALIAAGLVVEAELPGQPGRGIRSVSFWPCGEQPKRGCPTPAHRMPGYRTVTLVGKDRYRVEIRISEEEEAKRDRQRDLDRTEDARADAVARSEYLLKESRQRMPAPAAAAPRQCAARHLRLVWSAP